MAHCISGIRQKTKSECNLNLYIYIILINFKRLYCGFLDNPKSLLNPNNLVFILLAVVIAIIAIYYRTTMLGFFGFYEPDGFYYYSAIRAIVNNNYAFPPVLATSGWPVQAPIAEAHGMYWLVLIPYAILQYFGVSYYTIMRLIPVAFALLDMVAAYFLSRYLSKDKLLGLLTMIFVALSMGNAARTSALIFRGDTFVTFFLMISLIFFVEVFRQENKNKKIIFALAAGAALAFSNFVWNGGSFADAIFLLSFAAVMLASFAFRKDDVIDSGRYILLSIFFWYLIATIAQLAGFIPGQQLIGLSYLPIYLMIIVLWLLVYYISRNVVNVMRSPVYRVGIIVSGTVIGIMALFLLDPSLTYSIFVSNGFAAAPGSFASTTQELQAPNFAFLSTSFGANLYTALPNLFLSMSYYSNIQNSIWVSSYGVLGVIALLLLFMPYLFMQIYDSGGLLSGNPKLRLEMNIPVLVIMSYFILTAYLQVHAIRFNSVLSIPIALISAYSLYWLFAYANSLKTKNFRYAMMAILGIIIIVVLYYLFNDAGYYSSNLVQADSINPQFISAMQWLGSNSPRNSVVLTLWPDGSVAEAIANRTVVMDSVGSENGTRATPFAAWILNDSPNPQFLKSRIIGSPNYLVVRNSWLIETQGIYIESALPTNESLYGYGTLTSFNESIINSTARRITFRNQGDYPRVVVTLTYSNQTNNVIGAYAYIQIDPSHISPFSQLAFYDRDNANFSLITQSKYNTTNGELLMVEYSTLPRQGLYLNLTGAYVFGPAIAQSNMIKFLYLCNSYYCYWNNNQSKLQFVYGNSDTKIFKIIYNSTG